MFEYGQGVGQDYGEAAAWYRLAAEQGNGTGQHNLGLLYAAGTGVPQDYAEAYKWFNLALSRVDDALRADAMDLRDRTAAKMTREQIDEGVRRADEWERGQ